MNTRSIVQRETAVSAVINAVIGAGFFFLMFGLARPIEGTAFGRDFFPQAFMVALMGSLVPGLLARRHGGGSLSGVVLRALGLAIASTAIAGGGGFGLAILAGSIPAAPGLAIKVLFGMALSLIVTPIAVRAALVPQKART